MDELNVDTIYQEEPIDVVQDPLGRQHILYGGEDVDAAVESAATEVVGADDEILGAREEILGDEEVLGDDEILGAREEILGDDEILGVQHFKTGHYDRGLDVICAR